MELYYEHGTSTYKIEVEQQPDFWEVHINDRVYQVSASELGGGQIQVIANGLPFHPRVFCSGRNRFIFFDGETYQLKRAIHAAASHDHVEGEILSPIGGKIVKIFVSEGDIVDKNENLLIIESMKMEHRVKAPMKGTVMRLRYGEDAIVDTGEVLVDMERDKSTNGQAEW
jgi:biotin carboxyl carrier protein